MQITAGSAETDRKKIAPLMVRDMYSGAPTGGQARSDDDTRHPAVSGHYLPDHLGGRRLLRAQPRTGVTLVRTNQWFAPALLPRHLGARHRGDRAGPVPCRHRRAATLPVAAPALASAVGLGGLRADWLATGLHGRIADQGRPGAGAVAVRGRRSDGRGHA